MQATNKLELKDDISEDEKEKEVDRDEGSNKGEERSDKGLLINYRCYITSYQFFMLKVKKKIS